MGLLNMQLRDQSQVPTPDTGRIILFADSAAGKPRAKNAAGVIYDFVGNTGTRGSQWTYGTALPTDPGIAGDMYLKTDVGAVYQSAGGTSWVMIGNITGPQGPSVPLSSTTPSDVSTSAASGASTSGARADHVHAHGNLAGGTLHSAVSGSVNGFMIAADKTKLDTFGALSSTTPAAVGTAAVGVSTNLARADHVHAHGNQAGGTLHSVVTTSVNGFMTASDKTKLDALGSPATTATTVGAASAAGTSTNLAREDHVHAHGIQTDGTMHAAAVAGGANGFMTGADKTKLNAYGSLASTSATVGSANAAGTSSNMAREDHVHAHGVHTDGTMHAAVTSSVNGFMIAADKARLDTMTAAVAATDVGTASAAGASAAYARADHVHAHGNQAGDALHAAVTGSLNGFMISADKTKLDALGAPATTVTAVSTANVVGTSSNLARADHVHAHGAQTDGTLHAAVTGSTNGFMSAADKTKLDSHGALATTVTAIAATNVAGSSSNLAREDHVHAHGTQTDGTMHAAVTGAVNGFMIAADKTKLDSLPYITITPQPNKTTTTTLTVANTQYYVIGSAIPANALSVGSILRFTALASVATASTTAVVLTVRVHYGTTGTIADAVIATSAMTAGSTSGTAGSAELVSTAVVRAIGASGSVYLATRGSASGTAAFGTSGNTMATATGTLNTATAGVLGISWSANVANIWTIQAAFAEVKDQ